MDLSDAESRRRRGCSILFTPDSPCLMGLRPMLEGADRVTVAMWGLEQADRVAHILSDSHPEHDEPAEAVRLCRLWLHGEVKMPEAKRAILDVHAMAKLMDDPADAALCHAVGQGCSCVHTPKHALGLPVYELTAVFLRGGDPEEFVSMYVDSLKRISDEEKNGMILAGFLLGRKG